MTQPRRRRNVAKLLARLHPKGMALQPSPGNSRGGEPQETPLDIAGALGYASSQGPGPRLAAAVLCLRWWPGLIEGPLQVVGHRELRHTDMVRGEKRVRVERLSLEAPGETPAFRLVADTLACRLGGKISIIRALCQQRMDQAGMRAMAAVLPCVEGAAGPITTAKEMAEANQALKSAQRDLRAIEAVAANLGGWARAVIHEYRHPNHCQTCTPWGRAGEIPRPVEEGGKVRRVDWQTCPTCAGAGVLPWSGKRRAKLLRIGEHPWRNHLNPIHEGALSLLRELEWRGARALIRRLGA